MTERHDERLDNEWASDVVRHRRSIDRTTKDSISNRAESSEMRMIKGQVFRENQFGIMSIENARLMIAEFIEFRNLYFWSVAHTFATRAELSSSSAQIKRLVCSRLASPSASCFRTYFFIAYPSNQSCRQYQRQQFQAVTSC